VDGRSSRLRGGSRRWIARQQEEDEYRRQHRTPLSRTRPEIEPVEMDRDPGRIDAGTRGLIRSGRRAAVGFALSPRCRGQNSALPGVRGNGITSRMFVIPVT
jgi:hypothetical protein